MFHAFELRLVMIMLVVLAQCVLSLLSIANLLVGNLTGSFAALPIFIVATNAPLSLAMTVVIILDYMQRSPLSVLNEIIMCTAAGGFDLISAIAILLFRMEDAICGGRSASDLWSTCSAHFAIVALLWTSTFLLFAYAIGLLYTARRHDSLHPLDRGSVWHQTVKETSWARQTYSEDKPPGRRLRKKAPLDVESLRRVVLDKDNHTLSRMGSGSSPPLPATPSRSMIRPPGLNSPSAGFAERMGYFRRVSGGEYVSSTPTFPREFPQGSPRRVPTDNVERGAALNMRSPVAPRQPSFPDLPNPFPPQPTFSSSGLPTQKMDGPVSRSRASSNSSGNSGVNDLGLAGIAVGLEPQKGALRISIPRPLMPLPVRSGGSPETEPTKDPRSSTPLGGGQKRLFRASASTTPTSAQSFGLPRFSLQPLRSPNAPFPPESRQSGARLGYNYTHQHSRSHPSLSTASALGAAFGSNPLASPQAQQTRPRAGFASSPMATARPGLLTMPIPMIPVTAMSPSTKQRVSNHTYPLPLPPLSTYPIKSVAMSAGSSEDHSSSKPAPLIGDTTRAQLTERATKDRPLSTVSTISCYSTSSASHGPPPPREHLPSASLFSVEAKDSSVSGRNSSSAPLRRLSKSKKAPTLSRVPSHHGAAAQNPWGGTGNGPARRSLASQFQRPQARPIP